MYRIIARSGRDPRRRKVDAIEGVLPRLVGNLRFQAKVGALNYVIASRSFAVIDLNRSADETYMVSNVRHGVPIGASV